MKKYLFATFLLTALCAPAMADKVKPDAVLDFRRTLHLSFGQKNLVLEAPKDMCFLDESRPVEAGVIASFKATAARQNRGQVVALFTDCYAISNLGRSEGPFELIDAGIVMWMNPQIGETTRLNRRDYFDLRQTTLSQDVMSALTLFDSAAVDDKVKRAYDAVSLGYVATTTVEYQKYTISGVTAVTWLEGVPVDFIMTRVAEKDGNFKNELQDRMDIFVKQQVALNEKK